MPEYLVEMYVPRHDDAAVDAAAGRARSAADALARQGSLVTFVRSLFVPEDETCFFLYEAGSLDMVRAAATLAELPFDRVTEAVTVPSLAAPQE